MAMKTAQMNPKLLIETNKASMPAVVEALVAAQLKEGDEYPLNSNTVVIPIGQKFQDVPYTRLDEPSVANCGIEVLVVIVNNRTSPEMVVREIDYRLHEYFPENKGRIIVISVNDDLRQPLLDLTYFTVIKVSVADVTEIVGTHGLEVEATDVQKAVLAMSFEELPDFISLSGHSSSGKSTVLLNMYLRSRETDTALLYVLPNTYDRYQLHRMLQEKYGVECAPVTREIPSMDVMDLFDVILLDDATPELLEQFKESRTGHTKLVAALPADTEPDPDVTNSNYELVSWHKNWSL